MTDGYFGAGLSVSPKFIVGLCVVGGFWKVGVNMEEPLLLTVLLKIRKTLRPDCLWLAVGAFGSAEKRLRVAAVQRVTLPGMRRPLHSTHTGAECARHRR